MITPVRLSLSFTMIEVLLRSVVRAIRASHISRSRDHGKQAGLSALLNPQPTRPYDFKPIRCQQGFTLIEVLIAALVLAVGLLGLAGLQATSVKMNHSAYLRSQATMLAYEIADAMRANRSNMASYDDANKKYKSASCERKFTRDKFCSDETNIAQCDIEEWRNRLACLLPSGSATITVPNNSTRATISATWDESTVGGDSAQTASPQTVTFTTAP